MAVDGGGYGTTQGTTTTPSPTPASPAVATSQARPLGSALLPAADPAALKAAADAAATPPEYGRQQYLELVLLPISAICTAVFTGVNADSMGMGPKARLTAEALSGIVAYTCFYDLAKFALHRRSAWLRAVPKGVEDPQQTRAATFTTILHQLVICLAFGIAVLVLASSSSCAPAGGRDGILKWWRGTWDDGCLALATVGRHSIYAIFGLELKDMWTGLSLVFWVHHTLVFVGLSLSLAMPVGAGIVVSNGINAELGSGFYNMVFLEPESTAFMWVYFVTMTASNAFGVFCLVELLGVDGVPAGFDIAYAIMCISLVVLRTGGTFLEGKNRWAARKKEQAPPLARDATDQHTVEP